jgi:hypothetical protein
MVSICLSSPPLVHPGLRCVHLVLHQQILGSALLYNMSSPPVPAPLYRRHSTRYCSAWIILPWRDRRRSTIPFRSGAVASGSSARSSSIEASAQSVFHTQIVGQLSTRYSDCYSLPDGTGGGYLASMASITAFMAAASSPPPTAHRADLVFLDTPPGACRGKSWPPKLQCQRPPVLRPGAVGREPDSCRR